MANPDKTQSGEQQPSLHSPGRRRIIGGAAGAGVLFAVQAKTALGAVVCQSPSAMVSGSQSRPVTDDACWGGRSPGFWVQPGHFSNWNELIPPTFKPAVAISSNCNGLKNVSPCDLLTRGTMLNAMPAGFQSLGIAYGVWEAINWPTNYPTCTGFGTQTCAEVNGKTTDPFNGKGQLIRHLICAYLNAKSSWGYPITVAQVQEMWNSVLVGGQAYYYPNGPTEKGIDVIEYISGMYDTGGVSDDWGGNCKKN